MLLYKYVSLAVGRAILRKCAVGFSQSKYFNDPFDRPFEPTEPGTRRMDDPAGEVQKLLDFQTWSEATGILSLTRTPNNPLMWAHYADLHMGMVIGIDVIAAGMTKDESNLIPAQYGSVVYVSRRPQQPFIDAPQTSLVIGATHTFPRDHYEKLQRLFLHKPLCWSYEEEVRVLKCLKGIPAQGGANESGEFEIVRVDSGHIYLLSLPTCAIKEAYFGIHADLVESDNIFYEAREKYPELSMFECELDNENLTVRFSAYRAIGE